MTMPVSRIGNIARRLAAKGIDLVFYVLVGGVAVWMLMMGRTAGLIALALFVLIDWLYNVGLTRWFGGTLGKVALNLHVLTREGETIRLRHALRRYAVPGVVNTLGSAMFMVGVATWPDAVFQGLSFSKLTKMMSATTLQFDATVGQAWNIWLLANVALLLFQRQSRTLNDLLGGTIVVHRPNPG